MTLYIPHSIFHLARLLYVRPETFGPYYVRVSNDHFIHHQEFMIHCSPAEFITRFPALSRLLIVAAYCLRFSHNARNPPLRKTGYINGTELRNALHTCFKIAQQEIYTQ